MLEFTLKQLGAALRQRRTELGLTQQQVSNRTVALTGTYISQGFIAQIETADRGCRFKHITVLAVALEIKLSDLIKLGEATTRA
jgi:transcriptional regulator with XRE-family HTH domain